MTHRALEELQITQMGLAPHATGFSEFLKDNE